MDLFEKCYTDSGYFKNLKLTLDNFYVSPKLEGQPGPRMTYEGREVIMWSVNNYLGLAQDPDRQALLSTMDANDLAGPMGSRLMTGNTQRHEELEMQLADFCQKRAGILFNSGYLAVMGTINALMGENDTVIVDKDSHASIIDACNLATRHHGFRVFRHNDMKSLEFRLKKANENRNGGILIITEGVFSMSGDVAPLADICELKNKYDARLLLDDAHGIGVMGETGRGSGEYWGVQSEIDLYLATFTKTFAAMGAICTGDVEVINYIRFNARPNIFSCSVKNIFVEAVLASLSIIERKPELRQQMWHITNRLRDGLSRLGFSVSRPPSPITPVYFSDMYEAMEMIRMLRHRYNVFVFGVIYPVVPKGTLLLRMIPTAAHTDADVDETLFAFKECRDWLKAQSGQPAHVFFDKDSVSHPIEMV